MLSKSVLLILFFGSITYTLELSCHDCENSTAICDETRCEIVECNKHSTCDGSCLLTVELRNQTLKPAFTICLEGNGLDLTQVYGQSDLGKTCNQSADPVSLSDSTPTISCLCQSDFCNSLIFLTAKAEENDEEEPKNNSESDGNDAIYAVSTAVCVLFVILVLVGVVRYRKLKRESEKHALEKSKQHRFSADSSSLLDGGWDETGKHSCSTYKYSTSLGSHYSRGSKGNAVNQNDMHLPIELEKIIGRGRYAEVWKGKLQQDKDTAKIISVKVFRLPNYGAWRQEKEILSEKWMKHDNIIEYYASEQHSTHGLQYWLITAYYGKGNLHDFLVNNTLQWNEFCDMAASIAKGLAYLHSEHDDAGNDKLPVAHRDIKSCNILVKDDGITCVLADFGLSLKLDPTLTQEELANAGQVGTSRYMAPELLERLVNLGDIEMFKRVDVYAFALVMWELATRCEIFPGMVRPYQPPFGEIITDHPCKEQILLVCRSRKRPEIRPEWYNHAGFAKYVSSMIECWDSEPEARLTASCVYERILEIRKEETITEVSLSPKEEEALKKETLVVNEMNEMTELISTVV